jgi:hypothetical protein
MTKFICEYANTSQASYTAQAENDPNNTVTFDTFAAVVEFGESPDIELLLIKTGE